MKEGRKKERRMESGGNIDAAQRCINTRRERAILMGSLDQGGDQERGKRKRGFPFFFFLFFDRLEN